MQTSALPLGYVAVPEQLLAKVGECNEPTRERQYSVASERIAMSGAPGEPPPVPCEAELPTRPLTLGMTVSSRIAAMTRVAAVPATKWGLDSSVGPPTAAAMRRESAAEVGGATPKARQRR